MNDNKSATVKDLMSCVVNNPPLVSQLKALGFKSKNPEGMTFEEAMIASQISSAIRGDFRSYQIVMENAKNDGLTPLEKFVEWNTTEPEKTAGRGKNGRRK